VKGNRGERSKRKRRSSPKKKESPGDHSITKKRGGNGHSGKKQATREGPRGKFRLGQNTASIMRDLTWVNSEGRGVSKDGKITH